MAAQFSPAATAATTLPSRTSGATKLMMTDCVFGSVYGRLQPGSRPQRFSQGNVVFVVSGRERVHLLDGLSGPGLGDIGLAADCVEINQ